MHTCKEENATLNSSIFISHGVLFFLSKENWIPQAFDHLWILNLLWHIYKSSVFCPQSPLFLPEVGRQAAHMAWWSRGFTVAMGKQPAKTLREKTLHPI